MYRLAQLTLCLFFRLKSRACAGSARSVFADQMKYPQIDPPNTLSCVRCQITVNFAYSGRAGG